MLGNFGDHAKTNTAGFANATDATNFPFNVRRGQDETGEQPASTRRRSSNGARGALMMAGRFVCLRPPWVGAVGFLAWREWKIFSVIAGCWMVPFFQRSWRGGCLVMVSIRRCGLSCIWPPLLLSRSEIATSPSNVTLGVACVFLVFCPALIFAGLHGNIKWRHFKLGNLSSKKNIKIAIAIGELGHTCLNMRKKNQPDFQWPIEFLKGQRGRVQ